MTIEGVVAILAAVGAGALLRDGLRAVIKHWSGRAGRERSRIDRLEADRVAAERERDRQALWRRLLQEHASHLRSLWIEAGHSPTDLPPVPSEPRL